MAQPSKLLDVLPYIDVRFHACGQDAAVIAAIHRSIARLELDHPIHRASMAIRGRRRTTSIDLAVTLADGQLVVATTSQPDAYAAVANAFQAVRRRIADTSAAAAA